jgi:hypothetical protein
MSQITKLKQLLSDNRPHSTYEICEVVYGDSHLGVARIGARVWDLNHKHAFRIVGWKDTENPALYWYVHIPFDMAYLFDEGIKLGKNERESYYVARQKMSQMLAKQVSLFEQKNGETLKI